MPGDETLEVQINAKAFPAPDGSKRPVLRDVAFSAGMGLILAFFGPSGMGKSTILRIAAGLDADFEGFVRRPPGRLGMMFQEPRLAPWLSVADNIRLVATKGAPAPDIPGLLEEVGLRGASERWPRELSLGMARRVALARALTVAPDMLVLDEPFASLDPQLSAGLAAIVRARASRMRTLVLLASHELDQALAIADRILILSGEPATLGADLSVPRGEGASAIARLRGDLLSRFRFLNVQGNPTTTGSEVQASVHPGS